MADKIARWLQCQDSGWQCCSFCGVDVRKSAVKWVKASEDKNLNYCPHCGARMGYLPDIRKEPRWISVKDRLPEDTGDHLVYTCKEYTGIFWFDRDKKEWIEVGDYPCIAGYVTHWMPLPEPPTGDKS